MSERRVDLSLSTSMRVNERRGSPRKLLNELGGRFYIIYQSEVEILANNRPCGKFLFFYFSEISLKKFGKTKNSQKCFGWGSTTKLSMRPRRRVGGDQIPQPIRVRWF